MRSTIPASKRRTLARVIVAVLALMAASAALAQDRSREKAPEPAPVPALSSNGFDGDWTIRLDCPASANARAYTVDFPASVLNGKLFGANGPQGAAGAVQVEGTIEPDGNARLQARGRSAAPAGTPYSYDAAAHFDATTMSASGRRLEDRDCGLGFTRR